MSFGIGLFVLLLAIVCGGSSAARAQAATAGEAQLDWQIEIVVRSLFHVPSDYRITISARHPSRFAGFDELVLTLTKGDKSVPTTFLISADNKTLARMESFDLAKEAEPKIDIVVGRPVRGNPAAPVTVIGFDDLECPVCARMHQALFPAALERYGDKVRFIYKDNPLAELHPWATHAAVDAECLAAENGKAYWSFVDYVHGHVSDVTGKDRDPKKSFAALDDIARAKGTDAGVDRQKLDACLEKQDETAVQASLREARALGVNFAPAVYVNGERIEGFVAEPVLWEVIDRALRAAGEAPPAGPADGPAHAVSP